MAGRPYSRLAIASVALNLPWIALIGWCFWIIANAAGPITGEIFLLPLVVYLFTGIPAVICGLAAWARPRSSAGTLRGKWLAAFGMLLAAVPPAFGIVSACEPSSYYSEAGSTVPKPR